MGRIAELLEKKALGTLTNDEKKELETLTAEAALVAKGNEANDDANGDDVDQEIDEAAQKFADSVIGKVSPQIESLTKAIEKMHGVLPGASNEDVSKAIVVDKKLGSKTVAELGEIKVALPGRKEQGKGVTEVTMKTYHFVEALISKNVEKLQLLSEGTAADGGYLVPEEFANLIVEDIRDLAVMRTVAAAPITISGDTFHLPSLASRPKAQWRAEKATKNTSTVQFGENVFTPYSLAAIVGLSNELKADASIGVRGSIVNYVAGVMATSLNEKEEQAFWTGSGSGQPSGVSGYSLRTVAAGLTDSDRADAIKKAFRRTPQGYRNRGVWVANSQTWEHIDTLKDTQNNYLLTTLSDGFTQKLTGRPVYEQNDLAGGIALFGDFSYYQIVDREGISVDVSTEATVAGQSAFERNLTYIRVEKRVDAELTLVGAVTKVTGLGTP